MAGSTCVVSHPTMSPRRGLGTRLESVGRVGGRGTSTIPFAIAFPCLSVHVLFFLSLSLAYSLSLFRFKPLIAVSLSSPSLIAMEI